MRFPLQQSRRRCVYRRRGKCVIGNGCQLRHRRDNGRGTIKTSRRYLPPRRPRDFNNIPPDLSRLRYPLPFQFRLFFGWKFLLIEDRRHLAFIIFGKEIHRCYHRCSKLTFEILELNTSNYIFIMINYWKKKKHRNKNRIKLVPPRIFIKD